MIGDGLIPMTPSSISVSGGGSETATILSTGAVQFTAATSLSLNDVFTSSYRCYLMKITTAATTSTNYWFAQMRASGSNATGSNYTYQEAKALNTTTPSSRTSATTSMPVSTTDDANLCATVTHIYNPAHAVKTIMRLVDGNTDANASMYDVVSYHGLATAYDGLTMTHATACDGFVIVYAYEE